MASLSHCALPGGAGGARATPLEHAGRSRALCDKHVACTDAPARRAPPAALLLVRVRGGTRWRVDRGAATGHHCAVCAADAPVLRRGSAAADGALALFAQTVLDTQTVLDAPLLLSTHAAACTALWSCAGSTAFTGALAAGTRRGALPALLCSAVAAPSSEPRSSQDKEAGLQSRSQGAWGGRVGS